MTNDLFIPVREVISRVSERPMPRPYQQDALDKIRSLCDRGVNRSLLVAATGLGKAVMLGFLPDLFPQLARRGMMILVHRTELVEQLAETLAWIHPHKKIGIEKAFQKADPYYHDYIVASVQTLAHPKSNRLEKYKNRIGIICTDEAHHCSEGSQYHQILDFFGVGPTNKAPMNDGTMRLSVGATATPNRNDRKGLHMFFDDIAVNYDIRWGVEQGYLVDIQAIRVDTGTDISGVKTQRGDFAIGQLTDAINTHERNECIVKGWVEHGGKMGVAFCSGVAQAHDLASEFNNFGIEAHAIDGEMERGERKYIVDRFRRGEFPIITNCNVLTEGFDVKPVDTILMARPTKSTPLYVQCIGRGTRPVINPMQLTAEERVQAIRDSAKPSMRIIDFTDNTGNHSIITAPKLFGLSEKFETEGRSIFDLVRTIEAIEEEHPEKAVRHATNLEEIKIIASQISVWDIAETPQEMQAFTDHMWMNVREDVYQLHVPGNKDSLDSRDRQNTIYKLTADDLGRFSVTRIKQPVFEDGSVVQPETKATSNYLYNSLEEAIEATDTVVSRDHSAVSQLITNGQRWHKDSASSKQVEMLRKLKVYIPDGYELTKGKASKLISAALSQK